mmetsp:Transcript_146934/g.381873  ORF Transcript_146934/g.381873 Transcript_146934/m.381873 type:complete len:131 (-) Transcript_146934:48-440(-)
MPPSKDGLSTSAESTSWHSPADGEPLVVHGAFTRNGPTTSVVAGTPRGPRGVPTPVVSACERLEGRLQGRSSSSSSSNHSRHSSRLNNHSNRSLSLSCCSQCRTSSSSSNNNCSKGMAGKIRMDARRSAI